MKDTGKEANKTRELAYFYEIQTSSWTDTCTIFFVRREEREAFHDIATAHGSSEEVRFLQHSKLRF